MLAVFPLNIIMLPEESVALHLFEPRYRALFADHKCGKEFVILYQNKGTNSTCGTLVTIEQIVDEFPDGTVDVIVKGVQVVKILSFEPVMKDKIYSGVEVEKLRLFASADRRLTTHFKNYMSSIEKSSNKPEPYSLHYIADRLQLSNETKNEFICIASERAASAFLINEIRFLTNIREQEASLKHNFYLN
tara:strand:+ start:136864 stop:137433 length:570 start_codon:yes stop_codon:yes gene_type:complete